MSISTAALALRGYRGDGKDLIHKKQGALLKNAERL
jgi:hypothetical protein